MRDEVSVREAVVVMVVAVVGEVVVVDPGMGGAL